MHPAFPWHKSNPKLLFKLVFVSSLRFINCVCSWGLAGNRTRNIWHTGNYWLNSADKQHGTSFDNIILLKIPRFMNPLKFVALARTHNEPWRSHSKPLNGTQADESNWDIRGFLMHRASTTTGVIPMTLPVRSTEPINHHTCKNGYWSSLLTA